MGWQDGVYIIVHELICSVFIPAQLVISNLEIYSQALRSKRPRFTIKALLQDNEVVLQPDAPTIINGTIKVVQNIVEGTKRFVRYYK